MTTCNKMLQRMGNWKQKSDKIWEIWQYGQTGRQVEAAIRAAIRGQEPCQYMWAFLNIVAPLWGLGPPQIITINSLRKHTWKDTVEKSKEGKSPVNMWAFLSSKIIRAWSTLNVCNWCECACAAPYSLRKQAWKDEKKSRRARDLSIWAFLDIMVLRALYCNDHFK